MRSKWPRFRTVAIWRGGACWEGPLVSFQKEYVVRIWYVPCGEIGSCRVPTWLPDVYVVSENLHYFRWKSSQQLLPHFNMRLATPSICCFDYAKGDWDPTIAIAETIVLYAADWLRKYELWEVTGEWSGPESARVSMEMLVGRRQSSETESSGGRRGLENREGRKFRGPKMPTSASFPLMAAASKGSFPPASLRDLSDLFQTGPNLSTILTSSRELLPAA